MSAYVELKRHNAAEFRRMATQRRDDAHRAMARGDMERGAQHMRGAEKCERMAARLDLQAEAAQHRVRAENHRAHGHIDCAAECEPTCPRCAAAIPVDALCCPDCGEDLRWDVEVASW